MSRDIWKIKNPRGEAIASASRGDDSWITVACNAMTFRVRNLHEAQRLAEGLILRESPDLCVSNTSEACGMTKAAQLKTALARMVDAEACLGSAENILKQQGLKREAGILDTLIAAMDRAYQSMETKPKKRQRKKKVENKNES